MIGEKILVTGATGFIGTNLVKRLAGFGLDVTCLVRQPARARQLERQGVRIVAGDITGDLDGLADAVRGKDTVFHLAGLTTAPHRHELLDVNARGTENVLKACARQASSPVMIHVSSLAAAGPANNRQPLTEGGNCKPVSDYGRSKLLSEMACRKFADKLPITIVRPPIVLGPGDRAGLSLFKSIDNSGFHFVPGYRTHRFSVIHSDDLVEALISVADHGKRIDGETRSRGVYFTSADESPSWADLGRMVARALGKNAFVVPLPCWGLKVAGAVATGISRLLDRRLFLNADKAREATAGSWICSNQQLRAETNWRPMATLAERLEDTVRWYRAQGWLKAPGNREMLPFPDLHRGSRDRQQTA
jgi:nucleoside-diphosphate-sugar epimerase